MSSLWRKRRTNNNFFVRVDLNYRYKMASQYLGYLQDSLQLGWKAYCDSSSEQPLRMLALLHPEHISNLDLPSHKNVSQITQDVQGPRSFPSGIAAEKCKAHLIWGYNCSLDGELQQDHLFPYSLGGPTYGGNRITLCRYHNMVKSNDIHCFPWEGFDTWIAPWLENQVRKLRSKVFELYS